MIIEQKPFFSNKPLPRSAITSSGYQNYNRAGAAFLILVFATALVVMACTQLALRGTISERTSERQRKSKTQLETAIACTSDSDIVNKITLPLDPESDERIEVSRDGDLITATLMIGNQKLDSLTRKTP